MIRRITVAVVAGTLAASLAACSVTTSPPAPTPEPGTPAALAWEALMGPDGEYMAAAQYAAVIDEFGDVQPYVNIRAAELRHANALTRQLARFGVTAPDNPYLGTVSAPETLEDAAKAWAVGEVANVEMYDTLLGQTNDPGLVRVLTNLRRASQEAHLPMFEAAAARGGVLTEQQLTELGFGGGH